MKSYNEKLASLFRGLIYIAPGVLFFSYYPIISLGASSSMNFELSLPLIWLVVFDMVSLVLLVRKKLMKQIWQNWQWLLFPIFLTVTVLWSLNFLRGVLTAGILWLIYLAGFALVSLKSLFSEITVKERFWKGFLGAAVLVCVWCLVQCVLDLMGVGREYTLLCAGCTYEMFGFSHPNGFAIEPQFMGNLLIAPAMVMVYFSLKKHTNKKLEREPSRGVVFTTAKSDSHRYCSTGCSSVAVVKTTTGSGSLCSNFLLVCFFVLVSTLFLTFSRGAIYAFVVGMVFMSAMMAVGAKEEARKLVLKRVGVTWGVVAISFLFTLNLQGVMAQVSPTNDTYLTGVTKVLNHLSLGLIDVREKPQVSEGTQALPSEITGENEENVENRPVENLVEKPVENSDEKQAVFDGYVAESTDTRVKLTKVALEVWSKDFKTAIFGVGLGGAGQAMYVNGLTDSPKEIVQNQYASLLLETGLIGVMLLIFTLVLIVRAVMRNQNAEMVFSLMVAYAVSLGFFAGLPNALHIYLIPILIMLLL